MQTTSDRKKKARRWGEIYIPIPFLLLPISDGTTTEKPNPRGMGYMKCRHLFSTMQNWALYDFVQNAIEIIEAVNSSQ